MTVDPRSDRAIYRQVADILRAQIADGKLAPSTALPSEKRLADSHGVGRDTVRQAIALLRAEGLVKTVKGRGTVVRTSAPRRAILLTTGETAVARMPTDLERLTLQVEEGIPIIAVTNTQGQITLYSGAEICLTGGSVGIEGDR